MVQRTGLGVLLMVSGTPALLLHASFRTGPPSVASPQKIHCGGASCAKALRWKFSIPLMARISLRRASAICLCRLSWTPASCAALPKVPASNARSMKSAWRSSWRNASASAHDPHPWPAAESVDTDGSREYLSLCARFAFAPTRFRRALQKPLGGNHVESCPRNP